MPDYFSKMLKAGRTTMFFDVKEAKNGAKYLVITQIQLVDGGTKRRSSLRVFADTAGEFRKAVDEAVANIG